MSSKANTLAHLVSKALALILALAIFGGVVLKTTQAVKVEAPTQSPTSSPSSAPSPLLPRDYYLGFTKAAPPEAFRDITKFSNQGAHND